ncbi:hypothetical protein [Marinimicrobium sp. ABcell2]|uniref:hypothetical protein n=1 Tax=Marinimicrobium sp. ABcell2 TaxID=3069751 RepID=UPI0027B66F53|nr:hypothetical protein [Marinimicrobium sp. ABcell2]MDQ2076077.1 hypothetical protein [Marinimicrobium sp. ABcell2]
MAITDFERFSMLAMELLQTAGFIEDAAIMLENRGAWEHWEKRPSPYFTQQLTQLVQDAAKKQQSLLESLEDLTAEPMNSGVNLLDVLQRPSDNFPHSERLAGAQPKS